MVGIDIEVWTDHIIFSSLFLRPSLLRPSLSIIPESDSRLIFSVMNLQKVALWVGSILCLGRPLSSEVFVLETCRDVCISIWCNCFIDCLYLSDDGAGEFDDKYEDSTNPDQCGILCEAVHHPSEYFGEYDSNYTMTPSISPAPSR
jgi:hypothetical protein